MKSIFIIVACLICKSSAFAKLSPQVIYGHDDRYDISEIKDLQILRNSKAIATRVHKRDFKVKTHWFNYADFFDAVKLSSPFGSGVCSYERFAEQKVLGDCTGFLIKKNLLVTAAHCISDIDGIIKNRSNPVCRNYKWVFNFEKGKSNSKSARFNNDLRAYPMEDVYSCKRVIYSERDAREDADENFINYMDYAVIELDREVKDATVLKLSNRKKIKNNTKVYSIGHPSGLPKKVSTNAIVLKNDLSKSVFYTNLDSFSGNSGSPVIDAKSHEVIGISVLGRTDYIFDEYNDCYKINKCSSNGSSCLGISSTDELEAATKIEYINKLKLL